MAQLQLLALLPVLLFGGGQSAAADVMDGVRLLYNNDGENLWAVDSPYHKQVASAVDTAAIRGSARDVAGVADVDLICPFHNVPVR